MHFRESCKKLRMHAAAPMWRNGRRNGLKIRSREKRGMGSTPIIGTSKNVVSLGKNIRIRDFVDCEQSRTKTHENTVYSSSIRQVNSIDFESAWLFQNQEVIIPPAKSEGTRRTTIQEMLCECGIVIEFAQAKSAASCDQRKRVENFATA